MRSTPAGIAAVFSSPRNKLDLWIRLIRGISSRLTRSYAMVHSPRRLTSWRVPNLQFRSRSPRSSDIPPMRRAHTT